MNLYNQKLFQYWQFFIFHLNNRKFAIENCLHKTMTLPLASIKNNSRHIPAKLSHAIKESKICLFYLYAAAKSEIPIC